MSGWNMQTETPAVPSGKPYSNTEDRYIYTSYTEHILVEIFNSIGLVSSAV